MLPLILLALCVAKPAQPALVIATVAGTGKPGYSGDGGPATAAQLNQPFHCDLDGKGNLYIAEAFNHCIRKIDLKTGSISTVAGTAKPGYTGDGGPATRATMNEPYAVVVDRETRDLYIADRLNAVIRKVDGKTGVMSTVAGIGEKGYSGDGGPATKAAMREPNDCFLDGKGGLLIADVADWRVRRLDLKTGIITTFAGAGRSKDWKPGTLVQPGPAAKTVLPGVRGVCVDGFGDVFICLREGNAVVIVDRDGNVRPLAGTGKAGPITDADGLAIAFNGPKGIRARPGRQGDVYVVDTENHAIRAIARGDRQHVATVAGGQKGADGDGGDPRKAGLDRPHGIAVDEDGTLYISDSNNHRIRRVSRKK